MATENKVAEMFGSEANELTPKIEEMAVFIAVEGEALEQLVKEVSKKKENLDQAKADLSMLMQQNGITKVSLENGLTPKAVTKTKYFKQSGVTDEQFFAWLQDNDLADIIKPTVNFQTMQSTLKTFTGDIPEALFNISDVPTITMYGKSKFLVERNAE